MENLDENQGDKNKDIEELEKCLKTLVSLPCAPEEGRSAFTITDDVLDKLTGNEKDAGSPGPDGKKSQKSYMVLEKQEKNWHGIEDCVENTHARKVGTDLDSISALEKRAKEHGKVKCPCANGAPVCLENNLRSPLQCRTLVRDYIKCLRNYQQAYMERMLNAENEV